MKIHHLLSSLTNDRKHYIGQWKGTTRKTMVRKTLHRKLKIEEHKSYLKPGVNSGRVISSFSTIDTSRVTYTPRDKSYSVIYNYERRKKGDIMTTTMAHIRGHLWQRHYIALMVAVRKIFRNLPDCKYLLVGLWYQANLTVSWYGLYKCIEEDVSKLWNLCPIQLYYWTIKFVESASV